MIDPLLKIKGQPLSRKYCLDGGETVQDSELNTMECK
jgi:hypothetical protein